jgi:hypothetical protein
VEDLADAQRKVFRALLDNLEAPLSGDEQRDFLLRRNQVEACKGPGSSPTGGKASMFNLSQSVMDAQAISNAST